MSLLLIGLLIIGIPVAYVIFTYNGLVMLRNRVKEAFSDIGVQQKRRHNIIPNLVETVKGYAEHESGTLEQVVQARNAAMAASASGNMQEMQQSENMLTGTLKSLFALAENYPDLKANENFLHLQQELVDAEDKIQAARRFYNNVVQSLNTKIEQFPSNLIAKHFGFQLSDFFEIAAEEAVLPKVEF